MSWGIKTSGMESPSTTPSRVRPFKIVLHVEAHLRPCRSRSDQAAGASHREGVDRLPQHLGMPVHSRAYSTPPPVISCIFRTGSVVEELTVWVAPKPLEVLQAAVVDIYGDDSRAAAHHGCHYRAHPHRAGAENGDRRAGARFQRVDHAPCPGLDPAAQEVPAFPGASRLATFTTLRSLARTMGGKARLAEERSVNGLCALSQGGRAVQTGAREIGGKEARTMGRHAFLAGGHVPSER